MGQILIIEDDKQNAHLLEVLLTSMGHECTCLSNGEAALDTARQLAPNLMIMDLRLPGKINGWQLARLVRQNADVQHIPILAISVEIEPNDREAAIEAGCDEYLAKPCSIRILRECIQRCLSLESAR
jgi:two-component system, cell cycle response regulator DivK